MGKPRMQTVFIRQTEQRFTEARVAAQPRQTRLLEADIIVIIEVVDTGPGLPPKAQEHLFSPFSGSARKGGTGLGLAIAKHILNRHRGRFRIESAEGEGARFSVLLPIAP